MADLLKGGSLDLTERPVDSNEVGRPPRDAAGGKARR
jgi:hypothetical protein